jgi:hypothetical protein
MMISTPAKEPTLAFKSSQELETYYPLFLERES